MGKHAWTVVCLVAVSLSWPGRALPQTVSPEAVAAAKELMLASKMTDQINLMIPAVMPQLKPLVTKGDPRIERDFDELMPVVLKMANARLDDFVNAGAGIYARHFTADEIRQVTQFYRSPAGQKFLQKQPEVLKESMALGQRFGQAVAQDLQSHMAEELRKRGHNI
jgi:hypothetical protein